MFIELVGSLRCVRAHPPEWLVAAADVMEARDIVTGTLGCPTCGTRYPIERGIADFRDGHAGPGVPTSAGDDPELAVRTAALLGLDQPGGFVVLCGTWGGAAPALGGLVERMHVLVLDGPAALESGGGVSLARSAGEIPVRAMAARGIALDAAHADERGLASAAAALRPGGRLIAPATVPLPDGMEELARDESIWVAKRVAGSGEVVRLSVVRGGRA
ncbi:MAG TPA: hypothetical protein VF041_10335 [Gemmatimonadaceae bacterium]